MCIPAEGDVVRFESRRTTATRYASSPPYIAQDSCWLRPLHHVTWILRPDWLLSAQTPADAENLVRIFSQFDVFTGPTFSRPTRLGTLGTARPGRHTLLAWLGCPQPGTVRPVRQGNIPARMTRLCQSSWGPVEVPRYSLLGRLARLSEDKSSPGLAPTRKARHWLPLGMARSGVSARFALDGTLRSTNSRHSTWFGSPWLARRLGTGHALVGYGIHSTSVRVCVVTFSCSRS